MEILRTPDQRFVGLPGFPFEPNYVEVEGLRIHYVDEGPREAEPVLLLHGEPSWSFLYRKMIPPIVAAGYRAIAPDLVGFGRSDKPADRLEYTYQRHVDWMRGVVLSLGLSDITLFGQDWGGLIGLRLVAEHEDLFARVVAANTFLPTGDIPAGEAFQRWKRFTQEVPEFEIGRVINGGCVSELTDEVVAAYDAPFPEESYKAGARQFPMIVPVTPDDPASEDNRRAWEVLGRFEKPFLTAFSDSDPVTRGGDRFFQMAVPGAKGRPHAVVEQAGHFLQEDKGEELADIVIRFLKET